MSEGRFPYYHRLPPVVSTPQRHQLASAAIPSVPHLFTFHPPANAHQLSLKFAKQDMAAYRKTPYTSFHNGDGLQMHKPQYTPVTDRWMDSRNNMSPPSRPGLTSPSSAYSANVSPSFLLSRTVEFDLTKHKKESEQILIDLISNNKKYESFPYKQEKDRVNNQINSTKIETIKEKAMSVIAPNPDKFINSEVRCDIPDSISNQNVKCVNTEDYENKFSKKDIKIECVEQMMEALFIRNESEKQSVIKIVTPIKSPSIMRAVFVEKILKSPSPIPGIEHDKSEDFIPSENSSKQKHDTHPQFIKVENKLEELFGGVITSTNTSGQQIMTENKSKPIISTKRPCNKNKKQLKKVKKNLPVAEKLKKQKHYTHTQFIEVEKKLEELFGEVNTSTSTSDQQIMTENKSKPIISTKRPCNKNKKQLKKVKKNLPAAEKLKKQKHDTHSQFIEVEKKLEELFGEVNTSTSTSDQQIMTENKLKPIIYTKRCSNKNKKQLKKVKKNLPVAEKLKKQKHYTHTQFIEVEKKLEELFGGVNTSTSTSDQQIMTDNKSKPIISTKRPCNKNKKQLKKVKKNLPVAEKLKKQKHDTHSQFIEVEKKLEELFGGVNTSTSTSDQQLMTENKSKPIISTKRPCNENKKQLKKVKKNLPVAEKLKKQKHDTHSQFIEVEKKLEELFGEVNTSTSTSNQQIMTENKSKPIISTKRPCNENKKQLKKVKKNLPVAEKLKKQKHDTHIQFIEVEKKLEKLFGEVNTSTSTSDQQIMTDNKSKPIISTKRPCNKNKKQLKKVKKNLPVAEKLKKQKHDTHTQFIEVEKKLEKLFGGVNTSTSTCDQQLMTENKSKPIISTKRPCNENKKQLKKVNKKLPVAEKLKKQKHDTHSQFIEVEKKLEELFGEVNTSTSTSNQQIMTENKSKPIISTKRPCNENKKQLKKVKKNLPVAEKLKKQKHDTHIQFIEVEKKLEKLFGEVNTSTSTSDQQIMTDNKSKPIISTKRPCNKNKKQLKKVKKNLPVAEKLKKQKHVTHSQFIEVEKKLEELFGEVNTSTSTCDQQLMTENKSKPINSTKRPCNENKKQLKKVKKNLPVAEKLKKQKHDTHSQFIEVEKKLEELFGEVNTSTSTSDQQLMTENKSKSIISSKRPCNENKKQLKKVKKNLPVAEKLKKQKHDTHIQFIEVEKKLEKLFGEVNTSTSTSDQQIMTDNKSKPIISTKRPCNKNKKQLKKVKKNLPVAEKLKKQKHVTHSQFIEVEKKLEELFGEVNTSTSTCDQQLMTENKSKPIISTKRPCNENKKQLKKVKKNLPVAEKLKKQKHDTHSQFIEVEKKLEELFGEVNTSTSTSDQQLMTENKSKSIISSKRPCNENKKQLKKVKKNLPVAEKLKKQNHDTHPQFIEVEKKLEELFGEVNTSTSTSDQQIMTDNKSKPIISTKRPCNKNKKQLKKVKKNLPVAEKLKTVVEPTTKKYKGPLVRINGGNIKNPTNFVIINRNAQDDNDSLDSRNIDQKTFTYSSGGCNGEEKPDVNNLESGDWKCVYCSRGPNVRNIVQDPSGDLFGPYYVRKPKVVKSNYNPKQKKTMHNLNDNDISKTYIEVWTHANCLVWASGVFMVGDKIIGLEDSVRDVTNTICSYCGVNGASIGCIAHHCKMCAHYNCAIHFGWFLNSQNLMTTCNKHKNSPLGRSCH